MIDLQHPVPANLAAQPPPNLTTFDTRLNSVCVDGSHAGHHCDNNADCRLCQGGLYDKKPCSNDAGCVGPPNGTCPAGGTCSNLVACTAAGEMNGCARWVGKPGTFYESQGPPVSGPYTAARLQCTAYYHDWITETASAPITVVGAEIAPSSRYEVAVYGASCEGNESCCAAVSAAVTMYTRRSGDVDQPFNPPSATGQPDVTDVTQLVNKFKNLPGAPVKAIAQLQPNLPELNANINVLDVLAVVDAFKNNIAYAFSGPCACPSLVSCELTVCNSATPCVNAYGAGSTCVKTCAGGTNNGDPCIDNLYCPGGGACDKACANGSPNAGLPCNSMAECNTCNGNSNLPCNDNGDCEVGTCSTYACVVTNNTGYCRDRCGRCTP